MRPQASVIAFASAVAVDGDGVAHLRTGAPATLVCTALIRQFNRVAGMS